MIKEIYKQIPIAGLDKYRFDEKQHLHLLNKQPLTGTSSIGNILAKPLTWYASGMAVSVLGVPDAKIFTRIKKGTATEEEMTELEEAVGKKFEEIRKLSTREFIKLLDAAYRAHDINKREKADIGTDRHSACEKWIKSVIEEKETEPDPSIISFVEWSKKNVKRFLFSEIHCYSKKYWLGGICDTGIELKNGEMGIIDFKSSKEAYPNQYFQTAGYGLQLEENGGFTAEGKKIFELEKKLNFYAVLPFGAEKPKPALRYDIEKNKEAFLCALTLYRQINNYN